MTPALAALGLRDYQQNAIGSMAQDFFEQSLSRLLGVLPTGTGKTVIAASLFHHPSIRQWLETFPVTHRKLIMIAHTEELVDQSADKMRHYNPTCKVGIERAEHAADPDCDIICASVQTLSARKGRRLAKIDKDQVRIVIMDEAHHSIANTYQSVNKYFDLLPPDTFMPKTSKQSKAEALDFQRERLRVWDAQGKPERLLLGITATPMRTDRIGLEAVYQTIAFEETMMDMIRHDPPYLCRPRAFRVTSKTRLDDVKTKEGDFDQAELARAVMTEERNRLIVKAWMTHAEHRPTFAFCASVDHARDVARCFNEHGIKAEMICGESPDRAGIIARFKSGETTVLTNFGVLVEGVDVPSVSCILHARPTKSPLLYTQMTGRGTRLSPGKENFIVIDVVDVTKKHSLITAPTLFGLPMDFDAQGKDLSDIEEKIAKAKEEKPQLDITTIRSLHELEIRSKEVDLFNQRIEERIAEVANMQTTEGTLSWVKRQDNFELPYLGAVTHEKLMVRPRDGAFEIANMEFGTTTVIDSRIPTIQEALRRAEYWLKAKHPIVALDSQRTANWRREPITADQRRVLDLMKGRYGNVDALQTSGQAHDLIRLHYTHKFFDNDYFDRKQSA